MYFLCFFSLTDADDDEIEPEIHPIHFQVNIW